MCPRSDIYKPKWEWETGNHTNMPANVDPHILPVHRKTFCPKLSRIFCVTRLPNTAPEHPIDSPQVQSWSGMSQYRRNSAGHPSGLRWLSYMPQSDSARNREKCRETVERGPWGSPSSITWLQTRKHLSIPGEYKKVPQGWRISP